MTNRTMAPGGGSARTVPLKPANVREAATGGRVPVEQRDKPSPFKNSVPPFPHPWPFDPTEPKPRPQTWGNRFKAFKRYLASEKFADDIQWVILFAVAAATFYAINTGAFD